MISRRLSTVNLSEIIGTLVRKTNHRIEIDNYEYMNSIDLLYAPAGREMSPPATPTPT